LNKERLKSAFSLFDRVIITVVNAILGWKRIH
jgi:hypothetical protein